MLGQRLSSQLYKVGLMPWHGELHYCVSFGLSPAAAITVVILYGAGIILCLLLRVVCKLPAMVTISQPHLSPGAEAVPGAPTSLSSACGVCMSEPFLSTTATGEPE